MNLGIDTLTFEADPVANAWLAEMLSHRMSSCRLAALRILGRIVTPRRASLLAGASHDPDIRVATLASDLLARGPGEGFDLFEADFATGQLSEDLDWRWEYRFGVAHGLSGMLPEYDVWTRCDDEPLARSLAVMKACVGKEHDACLAVPILLSKYHVCRFTGRSRAS